MQRLRRYRITEQWNNTKFKAVYLKNEVSSVITIVFFVDVLPVARWFNIFDSEEQKKKTKQM